MLHQLLTSRDPNQRAVGMAVTRAEYPNLMSAIDHAVTAGGPLRPLVRAVEEYLDQAQQHHARRQLLEHLIAAVGQPDDPDRQHKLAVLHNPVPFSMQALVI